MRAQRDRFPGTGRPRKTPWLVLVTLVFLPAMVSAQAIAGGGSPLYLLAVRESVQGLTSRGSQQQQQQPATTPAGAGVANTNHVARAAVSPVGVSPQVLNEYYYYCTNCAAYHLRTTPLASTVQTNALPGFFPLMTNFVFGATNRVPEGAIRK